MGSILLSQSVCSGRVRIGCFLAAAWRLFIDALQEVIAAADANIQFGHCPRLAKRSVGCKLCYDSYGYVKKAHFAECLPIPHGWNLLR